METALPSKRLSRAERETRLRAHAHTQGVELEHLRAVLRARAAYRLAQFFRLRSRKRRAGRGYPGARLKSATKFKLAGEGRFHELLKLGGLDERKFSELVGIHYQSVMAWAGHPLHAWPVQFLEHYVHNLNMAQFLAANGWDPEKFKPASLPLAPTGRYPRTTEQGRALIEAAASAVKEET